MEKLDGLIEELDIEEFSQSDEGDHEKPPARLYIIRIDRERRRVSESQLTGEAILSLVGKDSETHKLYQKFCGGRTEHVEPLDEVSFVAPGVERFQTIPLDTFEGCEND